MSDINQNIHMQSQNTEVGLNYLLKITKMKIKPNGIQYFFHPLGKMCTIASLPNIVEKDLIFSMSCIEPAQTSILLPTNLIVPQVYLNRIKNEENLIQEIYKEGENFAKVIQILD